MKKIALALTAVAFSTLLSSCTADEMPTKESKPKDIKQETKANVNMGGEHGSSEG